MCICYGAYLSMLSHDECFVVVSEVVLFLFYHSADCSIISCFLCLSVVLRRMPFYGVPGPLQVHGVVFEVNSS